MRGSECIVFSGIDVNVFELELEIISASGTGDGTDLIEEKLWELGQES